MRPSLKRHVLALLREKLGMSQKDLADYVDCSESTLQAVERGPVRLKLSEALAIKISLATGVDAEWLLANDFSRPIEPSHATSVLYQMARGVPPEGYTADLFDIVQASKKALPISPSIYNEQLFALKDHARLRSAIENARRNHLFDLARFKLSKFIDQFQAEFGSDPTVFEWDQSGMDQVLEFIDKELSSARHFLALVEYDPRQSDSPREAKRRVEKLLREMMKTSPYPKRKKQSPHKPLTEDDL